MIAVFALGLLLISLAIPARGDWPILAHPQVRLRLWQAGLALTALAIIAGDYQAGGLAALTVLTVLMVALIGLFFWMDRGRFDDNHMRRSMGWYFRECGPGGRPMGGHRIMALVTFAILLGLLLLRPVARTILGLNDTAVAAASVFW